MNDPALIKFSLMEFCFIFGIFIGILISNKYGE